MLTPKRRSVCVEVELRRILSYMIIYIIQLYNLIANVFSRADLVQYDKLSKSNAMFNLNHAFNLAEKEFGLVKLLDAGQFLDHYYWWI